MILLVLLDTHDIFDTFGTFDTAIFSIRTGSGYNQIFIDDNSFDMYDKLYDRSNYLCHPAHDLYDRYVRFDLIQVNISFRSLCHKYFCYDINLNKQCIRYKKKSLHFYQVTIDSFTESFHLLKILILIHF